MAERFTSTDVAGDSTPWSPTDESYLQLKAASPDARVDVLARVDTGADWVVVAQLNNRVVQTDEGVVTGKIVRLPKYPLLKCSINRNAADSSISVRDNS